MIINYVLLVFGMIWDRGLVVVVTDTTERYIFIIGRRKDGKHQLCRNFGIAQWSTLFLAGVVMGEKNWTQFISFNMNIE